MIFMKHARLSLGILLSMLFVTPAYPHGGGLDAYGCPNNRKAGGYHCHRGSFAGESFSSKAEMLERLKAAANGEKRDPQKHKNEQRPN